MCTARATNFVPLNCKSPRYPAWPTNHCIVLVLQVAPGNYTSSENVGTKLSFIFMDNYQLVQFSLAFSWLLTIRVHVRNFTNSVLILRSSSVCLIIRTKVQMYGKHVRKGLPQQAEVVQGVPGRLRSRIFLTFRHYKSGSSSNAPAAFTPGEIPGTHFQRLSRPQGTWFCRGYHGKNLQ